MKSPIFLFSLPRSGSTLLQRILNIHPEINSVAEPWVLLPFIYSLKESGTVTEYNHKVMNSAINDFINNLPNKSDDYYKALRQFITTLYEKQCVDGEKYFLDKTPRYYNIIPEIAKIFPNAKFIFLFRNPIHVMSSIINTWNHGRLKNLYFFKRDLEVGPVALSEGYHLLKDRAYAVRYEELVVNPVLVIKDLCRYLEIGFDKNMLVTIGSKKTKWKMGDPTGILEYKEVSTKSLLKWEITFNTKFRKKLAYNYINRFSKNILLEQGYEKSKILDEIKQLKTEKNKSLIDRYDLIYNRLYRTIQPNIWWKGEIKKWAKGEYLS